MNDMLINEIGQLVKNFSLFRIKPLFYENQVMTRGLFYLAIDDLLNNKSDSQIYKYEKTSETLVKIISSNFLFEKQRNIGSYKKYLESCENEFSSGRVDNNILQYYKKYDFCLKDDYSKEKIVKYLCELVIRDFLLYAIHTYCMNKLVYSSIYDKYFRLKSKQCETQFMEFKNKVQKIIFYYSAQISSVKSIEQWSIRTYEAIKSDEEDERIIIGATVIKQHMDDLFSIF